MVDVGGYLKKEREARGISLEEISEVTKISMEFLRAIENNEFNKLPAEVFVIGFIKSYAKFIGLDENEVVNMYKQYVQEKEAEDEKEIRETIKKRRFPVLLTGAIVIILAVVLFLLLYKKNQPEKMRINIAHTKSFPAATTYPAPATNTPKKRIILEIVGIARGVKPVYVQYCTDTTCRKTRSFWEEKYLHKGEKITITARELIGVMVDNAGGIKIYRNGKDLGSPGEYGSTVVKFFRPGENEP